MSETTKVIFRKFANGEVIALFPDIPSDNRGVCCLSFMHIGQHSAASLEVAAGMTRVAGEEEYKSLKEELEQIGYNLKIIKRVPKDSFQNRIESLCSQNR